MFYALGISACEKGWEAELAICACVQAWERQVAELSRQLSRAAADKDDAERERQSLLDALRNSEQVFSSALDCPYLSTVILKWHASDAGLSLYHHG